VFVVAVLRRQLRANQKHHNQADTLQISRGVLSRSEVVARNLYISTVFYEN